MRTTVYLSLLLFLSYHATAQNPANDIALIKKSGSVLLNSAPVRTTFYTKNIQTQMAKTCVYEMTCGKFARGLFKEFGPIKGFFLSIDRVGRCTHISTMETLPNRLTTAGKITEEPKDYRMRP